MSELIQFVALAFAVWRVTRLVNRENGPALVLEHLRLRAGVVRTELDEFVARDGSVGELLVCFYCLSTWLGMLVGLAYYGDVVMGLGLGGVAVFLESCFERIRWVSK